MNIWEQVLARIETKMNRHSFITWFKPTACVSDDGIQVTIRVPTLTFRNWLLKHYAGVIADALAEVGRPGTILDFVFQQPAAEADGSGGPVHLSSPRQPAASGSPFGGGASAWPTGPVPVTPVMPVSPAPAVPAAPATHATPAGSVHPFAPAAAWMTSPAAAPTPHPFAAPDPRAGQGSGGHGSSPSGLFDAPPYDPPLPARSAPHVVTPTGIVGPNAGAPHISPARMPPTQVVNSNTLHINTSSAHSAARDMESSGDSSGSETDAGQHPAGLNPRYTFETFVVGPSNQFAHAACRAVAEAPARSYNPLYIYGGVGLGKTHLMHAIGHYMLQHGRNLRLTYISSERFMNEMINALRYERILDFRERYRNVDVLLVDDIQFIAGKESTQTEFFHTFNALFDSAKQIVISSDCPPHEITSLEERLRSRFEWGLIADIQPPDLETKVAILKKKADADGMPLPDNVAIYIAGKIKSNIRELEGSLIRLVAYASMTGAEVTLQLAQHVLRNVLSNDERVVTIEIIQKFVADYYQLKPSELKSRNNSKSIALPRQIAMYLCKNLTKASLPEIGKSFGGKHHSTVIHSIQKIEGMRRADGDFNTHVNNLLMNFQ